MLLQVEVMPGSHGAPADGKGLVGVPLVLLQEGLLGSVELLEEGEGKAWFPWSSSRRDAMPRSCGAPTEGRQSWLQMVLLLKGVMMEFHWWLLMFQVRELEVKWCPRLK